MTSMDEKSGKWILTHMDMSITDDVYKARVNHPGFFIWPELIKKADVFVGLSS